MRENPQQMGQGYVHTNSIIPFYRSPSGSDTDSLRDLYMWGEGVEGGILGGGRGRTSKDGIISDALLPRRLDCSRIPDIETVSCGSKHVGIVTTQGEVFCWGQDDYGRLGHKISMDVPNPKCVESLKTIHAESIECASNHTCTLTSSGELYAWGDSSHGLNPIVNGRSRSCWIPHKISGSLEGICVTKVACGVWHTAVVTSSGQLFTFGDGTFGILGHGSVQNVLEPKEVESLKGLRVKSVACGPWHTAAVIDIMVGRSWGGTGGGKLFTWGDNKYGRLGHQGKDRRLLPACVVSLVDFDFVQVSCGYTITVAVTIAGRVFTMGSSKNGQLGNPQSRSKSITSVTGSLEDKHVKKISCGGYHVIALTTKREVYSWGKGANGRLGLGDIEDRSSPTLVEFLKDRQVEDVSCGSSFSAAICLRKSRDISSCSGCKLGFGFTRRKHVCCNCGSSFCSSCSSNRTTNAHDKSKQLRVCELCLSQKEKTVDVVRPKTPRLLQFPWKSFSEKRINSREEASSQRLTYTNSLFRNEGTRSFDRQASSKHEKIRDIEDVRTLKRETQRWGEVSCPPQFTSLKSEYLTKPSLPCKSSSLRNLQRSSSVPKALKFCRLEVRPDFSYDEKLTEEVLQLRTKVENLMKQCSMKSAKLQLYKQKIDETWSAARAEAAKCNAAKDIIKVLTAELNTTSTKSYPKREVTNLKSLLSNKIDIHNPQIIPVQTELYQRENSELFSTLDLPWDEKVLGPKKTNSSPMQLNFHLIEVEWVEQDEKGVYVTLLRSPSGKKTLKRVRFSRKRFKRTEAERWWNQNYVRVYEKYNIEKTSSLVAATNDCIC